MAASSAEAVLASLACELLNRPYTLKEEAVATGGVTGGVILAIPPAL